MTLAFEQFKNTFIYFCILFARMTSYRTAPSYQTRDRAIDWFWGNIEEYYVKNIFKRTINAAQKRKNSSQEQKFGSALFRIWNRTFLESILWCVALANLTRKALGMSLRW